MAILLSSSPLDTRLADKRRHPAIYREAPSSATIEQLTDREFLRALRAAATGTVYVQLEQTYNARLDELQRLRLLENGWDSYGAPAPQEASFAAAKQALALLRLLRALPDAIRASNDGGIGICFTAAAKYAHIEFLNTGEACALMYGANDEPQVWDLSIGDDLAATWKRIRAYLQS